MNNLKQICLLILLLLVLKTKSIQVILGNGTTRHFETPSFAGNKFPIDDGKIIGFVEFIGNVTDEFGSCIK